MKDFIKKLLSGGDEVSSKRFALVVSLFLHVAMITCAFFKISIPEYLFYGNLGLLTGLAGLTVVGAKSAPTTPVGLPDQPAKP
jgi:hypothetical protein